jgi:hypothetical protein
MHTTIFSRQAMYAAEIDTRPYDRLPKCDGKCDKTLQPKAKRYLSAFDPAQGAGKPAAARLPLVEFFN